MSTTRPAAEVRVTLPLVRHLLQQCPQYAGMPLRVVGTGWDNVVLRLGDQLAVRVPRRAQAAPLLLHEQRWLPLLAPRLPVPVPVPVFAGVPQGDYPWAWSVVPWFDGVPAAAALRDGRGAGEAVARTLADFVNALHRPAPAAAPHNPVRGVPLPERRQAISERLEDARLRAAWLEWSAAPPWTGPRVWVHGDLHPLNVVLDDAAALAAVVDFGDLTAGDPAYDLAAAWLLFEAPEREVFMRRVGAARRPPAGQGAAWDAAWEATWTRARACALALGALFRATGAPGTHEEAIGRFALRQLGLE